MDNRKARPVKFQMPGPDLKRARLSGPGSETPNERGHSEDADKDAMNNTLSQGKPYQETTGSKRRPSSDDFQSESKRSRLSSDSDVRSESRLGAGCDEERTVVQRAPEAKMIATCDNRECTGSHSPGQCPLSNKCRGCQSTRHTSSNCTEVCKDCGSGESIPLQNVAGKANASDLALEKPCNDDAIDTQGQRLELARPTVPDSQPSTLTSRQLQLDEEYRVHWMDMAESDARFADLEMRQGHIHAEQREYDEFNRKRAETMRRREKIERLLKRQLEEIDRQSEEDERQHTRQLQAMKEGQDQELDELRQRQKRSHESAPA
ncbi:MAG: hypothetical protein L6R38_006158 [Xanthoria sp. 2 TBL-2021]|nr:MAG: hypothetical protein L6R38_006158 [Xanthoria sp. 2 TBL-2021]